MSQQPLLYICFPDSMSFLSSGYPPREEARTRAPLDPWPGDVQGTVANPSLQPLPHGILDRSGLLVGPPITGPNSPQRPPGPNRAGTGGLDPYPGRGYMSLLGASRLRSSGVTSRIAGGATRSSYIVRTAWCHGRSGTTIGGGPGLVSPDVISIWGSQRQNLRTLGRSCYIRMHPRHIMCGS